MPRAVVHLVEPDATLRSTFEEHLSSASYKVRAFGSFPAFESFRETAMAGPDLVIAPVDLPDVPPEAVIEAVKDEAAVIFTGPGGSRPDVPARALELMRLGAADYLARPVDVAALLGAVEKALRVRALERRVRSLSDRVSDITGESSGIVGRSAAIDAVRRDIARAARGPLPVLVLGETGVGKELVAREIHRLSGRDGEFVAINAAGLGENLFETELFGYEPGAFTGARGRKVGLVETAHRGTLLLDEIGEMPAAVQARVLRFLDDSRFRRVGGLKEIEADVRVIAATNRAVDAAGGPPAEAARGDFRSDLYFRLSAFTIRVPPLAERRDDVADLARHFLAHFARRHGLGDRRFSEAALACLAAQAWPGNVRELKNAVERLAVTLSDLETIDERDVEPFLTRPASPPTGGSYQEQRRRCLDDFDRAYLSRLLERHMRNISAAAREIGLDRKTLSQRLKELDLK